jgi:hypothetical protein
MIGPMNADAGRPRWLRWVRVHRRRASRATAPARSARDEAVARALEELATAISRTIEDKLARGEDVSWQMGKMLAVIADPSPPASSRRR